MERCRSRHAEIWQVGEMRELEDAPASYKSISPVCGNILDFML